MARPVLNSKQIKEKFQELASGNFTPQQRGYEFEKLIFSILENEKLEPRASYKPEGEQVDGSFYFQGQTFLIEAKWVKDPLPASSIYSFKGKLDGKFHTSSGIFISVNGYNNDVEDALKFGKSLNILLFDENDIPLIFNGDVSFSEVLKFKLREAGDTGSLKVPYKLKRRAKEIFETNSKFVEELNVVKNRNNLQKRNIPIDDLLVFVEGKSDLPIIKNLLFPIKKQYSLSYKIEVLNGADNIRQLPSLISLYGDYDKTKAVIVILDDDNAAKGLEPVIKNLITQFEKSSIPVRPLFLLINEKLKLQLSTYELPIENLRADLIFEKLETFIKQIAEDYYNPQTATPFETLKSRMEALECSFEDKTIGGEDEYTGMPFSIASLVELIEYLNQEIIQALYGEMPLDWLKEQDELDYEDYVREFLRENYSSQIIQLGWDIDEL